jgi:hypothetical protein
MSDHKNGRGIVGLWSEQETEDSRYACEFDLSNAQNDDKIHVACS